MPAEALYPDRIWGALKTLTGAPSHPLRNTSFQEGRRYQLLEVAVGLVMARLQPDFEWTVTPIQGDQGIDFLGVRKLFEVQGLDFASYEVIAGQCKRAKGKIRIEKELSYDVFRITEVAKPSHVILALAAPASKKQQEEARARFINRFHRPFTFFGLLELDFLFRRHLSDLVPLFEKGLKPERSAELIRHFSSARPQGHRAPTVRVRSPSTGATGVPFELRIDFEAGATTTEEVYWSWTSPTLPMAGSEVATLRLISPVSADRAPGQLLQLGSSPRTTETIRLIGYVCGAQSLGDIVLSDRQGVPLTSVGLGNIELADQNTPPYYWEPFEKQLDEFSRLWARAKAGAPLGVAVTGAGGAGKTRLCEELGFRATRDEGRYFQIVHPKALDWPYRIFVDLLTKLVDLSIATDSPAERVLEFLGSRNAELADRFKSTVHLLFRDSEVEPSATDAFDEENLTQLLCFVLLENSRLQPLLIHVADCHWGQFSSFNLLAEVMARLQSTRNNALTRILFIFEGRVGEVLPDSTGELTTRSIAPWERFIASHLACTLHISPLSADQSGDFLDYVFESSESPHRRVPRSLLVSQDELKREIIRYAKGNPFHMVEQINLLRQEHTIARNQRTGLFYLASRLARSYEPPQSVEELIQFRLDYLRDKNTEMVRLICALAFVKDRVSRELFRHLRIRLAPNLARNRLVASEFLDGVLAIGGEVSFRHENYYRVAHRYALQPADFREIVQAYLDWFERSEGASPQSLFEQALVLQRAENTPTAKVQSLLRRVVDASESQHTHELSIRALEHLIASYPESDSLTAPLPALEAVQDCRLQLSKLVTLVGDWREAAATLERAVEDFERAFRRRQETPENRTRLEVKYFGARIELADAKKNQLHHHEAIQILSDILPELELRRESDREAVGAGKDWIALSLWARNRLGVALWFDGRLEKGRVVLAEGLELAREIGDPIAEYNFLLDYGTLLLHQQPCEGVELLSTALEIVRRPDVASLPRDEHILKWQRCLGELLASWGDVKKREEITWRISRQLQQVYLDAERGGYTHETGGSALLLGSCKAWLGEPSARRWLLRAISIAQRSSYLEYLWKGHLNLAQFLLSQSPAEVEGSAHHAEQAQRLITNDLQQRKRPEDRQWRTALFILPLAQLARVWLTIGDPRLRKLSKDYPQIKEYSFADGEVRGDRSSPTQVLHISRGSDDYFLMN